MNAPSPNTSRRWTNWLLIGLVILLVVVPLVLRNGSEFGGSDNAAQEAISSVDPGYQPWFTPLWVPPGSEIESLLFALQAALGAAVIGYFFGLKRGQRQAIDRQKSENALNSSSEQHSHASN